MDQKTVKSFIKQIGAYLKGDSNEVLAQKIYRQAKSALSLQVNVREGQLISAEEAIDAAEQSLLAARVNKGQLLNSNDIEAGSYVTRIFEARKALDDAKKRKERLEKEIATLKEELELLDKDEPAE